MPPLEDRYLTPIVVLSPLFCLHLTFPPEISNLHDSCNIKNSMKKMTSLLGVLLVFSLMMFTSRASAESRVTNNTLISSDLKNHTVRPPVRGLSYGEFFRDWHNWYHSIVDKPFYLHVNDVFIGKLTMSRDNRLVFSTPLSGSMMSHVTFGNSNVTFLQDTGRPNIGVGITRHMHNGLLFDTSVNFDLRDPSDVTVWVTLPAIRF